MLTKQGQLKIKTINGKIIARPDLKTAIGNGIVRKYATPQKGIRYRKIYKTKESRYMYLLTDITDFAAKTIEKKGKVDLTDAAIAGTLGGLGGGVGTGYLAGEYLARNKNKLAKTKYGVGGAVAGGIGLGGLAAYQSVRNQKKNFSSMLTVDFARENKKKKSIRSYTLSPDGKKKYLTPEEMHYEKNQRAKEELEYKQRRLDQAKAREERLQREDKRRPVEDVRKNISGAVNVSREAKGWVNTGNKLWGWFG